MKQQDKSCRSRGGNRRILLVVGYGFATSNGFDFIFLFVALPVGCWLIYNLTSEKDRRW
jgi:hypothetical protein